MEPIQYSTISAYAERFFAGSEPMALVYAPQGILVGCDLIHQRTIGGERRHLILDDDALLEKVELARTPPADQETYGATVGLVLVLNDDHCSITSLYRRASQTNETQRMLQLKTVEESSQSRHYADYLVRGEIVTSERCHLLSVAYEREMEPLYEVIGSPEVSAQQAAILVAEGSEEPQLVRIDRSPGNEPYFRFQKALTDIIDADSQGRHRLVKQLRQNTENSFTQSALVRSLEQLTKSDAPARSYEAIASRIFDYPAIARVRSSEVTATTAAPLTARSTGAREALVDLQSGIEFLSPEMRTDFAHRASKYLNKPAPSGAIQEYLREIVSLLSDDPSRLMALQKILIAVQLENRTKH